MEQISVRLRLPRATIVDLQARARLSGRTPAQVLRDLLDRAMNESAPTPLSQTESAAVVPLGGASNLQTEPDQPFFRTSRPRSSAI